MVDKKKTSVARLNIVDLLHPYTLLLCRVEAKLVRLKKEL
jgi:hypothetical protein